MIEYIATFVATYVPVFYILENNHIHSIELTLIIRAINIMSPLLYQYNQYYDQLQVSSSNQQPVGFRCCSLTQHRSSVQ